MKSGFTLRQAASIFLDIGYRLPLFTRYFR